MGSEFISVPKHEYTNDWWHNRRDADEIVEITIRCPKASGDNRAARDTPRRLVIVDDDFDEFEHETKLNMDVIMIEINQQIARIRRWREKQAKQAEQAPEKV